MTVRLLCWMVVLVAGCWRHYAQPICVLTIMISYCKLLVDRFQPDEMQGKAGFGEVPMLLHS